MKLANRIIKYRFGFSVWGLALFLAVMLPNFIWFAVPAPNDILRNESSTPIVDTIGTVFQMLFVASLCVIIKKDAVKIKLSPLVISAIICVLLYFAAWVMYYNGITEPFVILSLTVFPCLAFIFFGLDRKNVFSVVFAVCFAVCHLIYAAVNFIL